MKNNLHPNTIRRFHPVGHGGFYTEWHNNNKFLIVYDCGGSNKEIIERVIDTTFNKNKAIDLVFISHLHRDHINGLDYLLKNYQVNKVVLPLLEEEMKLYFLMQAGLKKGQTNNFISKLIEFPEEVLKEKLILVEQEASDGVIDINELLLEQDVKKIKSGTKLNLNNNWLFIPFNFNYNTYATKLKQELNVHGINSSNIINHIENNFETIKNIYRKIFHYTNLHNPNSLSLLSVSQSKNNYLLTKQDKKAFISSKLGCLYLGDLELANNSDLDKLKQAYGIFWKLISTIQIPHHGSIKNHNSNLIKGIDVAFISAKLNKHHPSPAVVKDIIKQKLFLTLITEKIETETQQILIKEFKDLIYLFPVEYKKLFKNHCPDLYF